MIQIEAYPPHNKKRLQRGGGVVATAWHPCSEPSDEFPDGQGITCGGARAENSATNGPLAADPANRRGRKVLAQKVTAAAELNLAMFALGVKLPDVHQRPSVPHLLQRGLLEVSNGILVVPIAGAERHLTIGENHHRTPYHRAARGGGWFRQSRLLSTVQ